MSQSEAMSENEAAEGGVVFEELSAVRSNVVDRGGGSEGACKAPGILLAGGRRGILEEATYGICSSGEWEVGFRGDEGREAKHGGEDIIERNCRSCRSQRCPGRRVKCDPR